MTTTTTTVHAPVEISRRRLAGLLAVVVAATAAVTWTVTTTVDNTAEPSRSATATREYGALGYPLGADLTSAAEAADTVSAKPIVVADFYHGAGFLVCQNGEQPVAVADAYHGTGTAVCP